jgi:hypothetical protein
MFHFPAFPPHTLCVQVRVTPHDWCRVSPFGHPGITARLTAPPGLSWPPTSFIGSWCQGIHRLPSATSLQRCSRPLCNSQTTANPNPTTNTHNPHHPQQAAQTQFVSQIGLDTRKNKPPTPPPGTPALVPSGPNRMSERDHQPHHPTRSTPQPPATPKEATTSQSSTRMRQPLPATHFTSVSANEHPAPTLAARGLLQPPSWPGAP